MGDMLKGSEPQQQVHVPPPLRPPMHGMANWLGNQLPSLWGRPLPSYQGNLDPGLSPTMQRGIQFLQDRASSAAPDILGRSQGTLGALMNPGMSGLRNPFSMTSNSGGGATMTPEALQSSRDAMLRFQNPQYSLPVPRIGQGFPSPFGLGGGQPQPGGPSPRPMPPRPGTPVTTMPGQRGYGPAPIAGWTPERHQQFMDSWRAAPFGRGQDGNPLPGGGGHPPGQMGPPPQFMDGMARFPNAGQGQPGGGFLNLLQQLHQKVGAAGGSGPPQQPPPVDPRLALLQASGKVF